MCAAIWNLRVGTPSSVQNSEEYELFLVFDSKKISKSISDESRDTHNITADLSGDQTQQLLLLAGLMGSLCHHVVRSVV